MKLKIFKDKIEREDRKTVSELYSHGHWDLYKSAKMLGKYIIIRMNTRKIISIFNLEEIYFDRITVIFSIVFNYL